MPPRLILPYWHTKDRSHTLYAGNALTVLKSLPSNSVHCVCTSPPYFQMRQHDAGPDEIGTEKTPEGYVERLVNIFSEVKRVLHPTGCVWLNIGDASHKGNLLGMPWRLVFALQADGWKCSRELPWLKRNSLPTGKSIETFFLLNKSVNHYFDLYAIKKPTRNFRDCDLWFESVSDESRAKGIAYGLVGQGDELVGLDVTVKNYKGAHYSVYPADLITPLIKASTSEKGCCPECLMPWTRVIDKERKPTRPARESKIFANGERINQNITGHRDPLRHVTTTTSIGWEPGCNCLSAPKLSGTSTSFSGEAYAPVPCTVLDPFLGSGTTSLCSISLGRHSIGIDLKEEYLAQQAVPRLSKALLEAGQSHLLLAEE